MYDFLKSLVPLQAYAVLILDEAQNLTSQLLEEIRILADLEGPEKLLQLVLVGQPELHDKLKDPAMRQVDQRISVRCSLETLEADAIPAYIEHRLTVAGGGGDRVEFAPEALELLYSASKGNPRVLNLIADKSLNRGHLDRTWVITPEIVSAAVGDLGYARPAPVKPPPAVEVVSPAAVTMPPPVARCRLPLPEPEPEPALENILPDFREESEHVREENERVLQEERGGRRPWHCRAPAPQRTASPPRCGSHDRWAHAGGGRPEPERVGIAALRALATRLASGSPRATEAPDRCRRRARHPARGLLRVGQALTYTPSAGLKPGTTYLTGPALTSLVVPTFRSCVS